MNIPVLLGKFLKWRARNVSVRLLVLILSVFIGFGAGIAAVLLKSSTHYIRQVVVNSFDKPYENFLFFALPFAGILITVIFVRLFIQEKIGHGISSILFAISRRRGILKFHKMYSSLVGSAFTVGLGGSAGLEAPIVSTGSAIGSNVGQFFKLNHKNIILLIGCGASGAIAAIFNAPIAAVVFGIEILMLDLTTASLVPLLIASVTGTVTAKMILGEEIMFYFKIRDEFLPADIPFYILLGVVCGLASYYFTRTDLYIEKKIKKIKNDYRRVLFGGLALGILIYIFPPLYGEGYQSIKALLRGDSMLLIANSPFNLLQGKELLLIAFLALLILFKVIATALTLGSGGIGGIFAPSLFTGGVIGFLFARVINYFQLPWQLSESNYTLVGMSGMMAGVLHAPLTALFLIAEITSGYQLIIPLMITSVISLITAKYFEPYSIYTKKLAQKGVLITHHKDKAVLTLMKLSEVIETDFEPIKSSDNLGELVKVVAKSKRNIFPVVDENGDLLGVVSLDDIREIMFSPEDYEETKVEQLMNPAPGYLSIKDSMENVMQIFTDTGAWNLPVVEDGRYVGFVSKSKLFSSYRKLLIQFSED